MTTTQPSTQPIIATSSSQSTISQRTSLGGATRTHTNDASFSGQPGDDPSTFATPQQTSAPTPTNVSPSDGPNGPDQPTDRRPSKLGPVIGGVAAAVLIGLVGIWLLRRRRRRNASIRKHRLSLNDKDNMGSFESVVPCDGDQPRDEHTSSTQEPSFALRLYDPDDPTTYPPTLSEILGETKTPTATELRQMLRRKA
ncbi:hypothetical protein ONZ51_g243 [Trametes cubensis]|uniref:Uncharacterized protein n=1 Tax=Trametes cubensis TaxID=1111947 RepID=A0AAD7XH21_9APHY|nr:hypothetical protein ONZ51_g243 [Trametes cubensis]